MTPQNNSFVLKGKAGEVYQSDRLNGGVLIPLSEGIFVSFYSRIRRYGIGISFENIRAQSITKILENLSKIENVFRANETEIEVKVVGSADAIRCVKESFKNCYSAPKWVMSFTEKDFSEIEVLFFPAEGKVKVAQALTVQNRPETRKIIELAPKAPEKVKLLIVDDSSTIRKLLSQIFSRDPGIEVVGAAEKPSQVEEYIKKYSPDVITLDIHMPEMDGVTLLKKIFPVYSIPTVMISSISMEEGPIVLEALENGAVDYIQKPSLDDLENVVPVILEKVKTAAKSRKNNAAIKVNKNTGESTRVASVGNFHNKYIAIGSSTGGTEALKEVFLRFPAQIPPVLVVQHIPAVFSLAFAQRLNEICPFDVKEAADGDEVRSNRVLIAPGGKQMKVIKSASGFSVRITDDAPVNRHKPSVDYLFDSVATLMGSSASGIILTGMGADGAKGLLKMKQAGSPTIAQDEATSVVFGMPREAIKIGAADFIKPLVEIPETLFKLLDRKKAA